MNTGQPIVLDDLDTNAHHFLKMKYYKKENINNVIPIMKHVEKCRKMVKVLKDTIEKNIQYVNLSYNNHILDDLRFIESNGLQTTNGIVHSEYNLFTSTGRPSNRFGGINFAALNKKDGSRKQFVSRFKNGVLVEMDFDAYHLRLIGDKINYALPSGSVHEHMAEFYGVDYEEAKSLSFQYLYGYIPEDVIQINQYFKKVSEYVKNLWKSYNSKEFIVSDIYKRQIHKKNLTDMNANKLFNYSIQLMETENNMKVLCLRRVPPGDRWVDIEDDTMMDNLTDALNHIFKREGVTNFTIEAATGEVFMLTDEKEPEVIRKYSIYGEN